MSEQTDLRANLVKALQALQTTRQKLNALETAQHEPIAVIGMACRLPGAATPEAFWQLLANGQDLVAEVPLSRWDMDQYYDPVPGKAGKSYVRTGAFLDQIDSFDAQFFGISPREAAKLDPQQRLLLEVTWEALERAGQAPASLKNSRTGVYVGVSASEYALLMNELTSAESYATTGNGVIFASGRLSHLLGFQGPNLVVDTACSASLIGVHLACESLRNRSSDLALAGGVHLLVAPHGYIMMSQLLSLAPDGHCKTFDAAANGYGRGEGCGMVVLKRLSDALADGDNILALIRGSAINHDGPSGGLTVPSATAQAALIRQALENGKVEPHEVHYIDAHGTGTALGDPIEVRALSTVFGQRTTPLVVGTVKTNLGHLEEAAGITGLIKVILAMHHAEIPPNLHFHHPSPHIDWARIKLQVPTARTPWPQTDAGEAGTAKKIAGVSSFGLGGSNAHVVVEAAPAAGGADASAPPPLARSTHLLTLSAKTGAALQALAQAYAEFLQVQPTVDLGDLCYTAYQGRSHFAQRLSIMATSVAQLQANLAAYATGKLAPGMHQATSAEEHAPPKVAWLFTGQGSQYVGMGRTLYAESPLFRDVIDRCDNVMQQTLGRSLVELLYPAAPPAHNDLMESHPCGQAVNFALECALADLWRSWGIQPTLVLGHSLGDFAAAYTAGVLTLEDGLRLVIARGQLMARAVGSMVSVLATAAEVAPLLADYPDVTIGVINGPKSVVISGGASNVALATAHLQAAGYKTRKLEIPVAAHSPLLDPLLDEFEAVVRGITLTPPQLPVISSMTGQRVTDALTDPRYWRQHLRNPVRFADGVATLAAEGCTIFLEIGPKPTLLSMVEPIYESQITHHESRIPPVLLPSLREDQPDWQQLLTSLGALYVHGLTFDWAGVDAGNSRRKIVLPTYPFQRQRYWLAPHELAQQEGATNGSQGVASALWLSNDRIGALTDLVAQRGAFGEESRETISKVLTVLNAEQQRDQLSDQLARMLYTVTWARLPQLPPILPPIAPGRWLILGSGAHDLGEQLVTRLAALGETVEALVDVPAPALISDRIAAALAAGLPLRGIVY